MVAEKLDRIDEVETRLKRLIELQAGQRAGAQCAGLHAGRPHAAHRRGPEADREGACSWRPDDPFILDSMGWAILSAGQARRVREVPAARAGERPDPEIAAHLGEVLWAKGERDARARGLAVATQGSAGQPGPARNHAPPRALAARAPRRTLDACARMRAGAVGACVRRGPVVAMAAAMSACTPTALERGAVATLPARESSFEIAGRLALGTAAMRSRETSSWRHDRRAR